MTHHDSLGVNRAQRRGYVRQRKVYKLTFEDHPGLEVRAHSVPLGTFMELIRLASIVDGGTGGLTASDAEAIGGLFQGFAAALVSWNLEDPVLDEFGNETGHSVPVPASIEGLYSQDSDFMLEVITAWMDAIAGVAGPLDRTSPGGGPSLAASLPMEPSSPSQPS